MLGDSVGEVGRGPPRLSSIPPPPDHRGIAGGSARVAVSADDVPAFQADEAGINKMLYFEQQRRRDCEKLAAAARFSEFVGWRDAAGNTVAHYLAEAGLTSSWQALMSEMVSRGGRELELRWVANKDGQTPQALRDGLSAISEREASLHRALRDGALMQTGSVPVNAAAVRRAVLWKGGDDDDEHGRDRKALEHALASGLVDEVVSLAASASLKMPERHLYGALAMIELEYSLKQVELAIHLYLEEISDMEAAASPLLYYTRFRLCMQTHKARSLLSTSTTTQYPDRNRRQLLSAVSALQCFPVFAAKWLTPSDLDVVEELIGAPVCNDENDDEEEDLFTDHVPGGDSSGPAAEWRIAKEVHSLSSSAMDALMDLAGISEIKEKTMSIVKEVLLRQVGYEEWGETRHENVGGMLTDFSLNYSLQERPASVKAGTSMNALFTGNPGVGKTTVARLLARAMAELGFRSEGALVETSAHEILKLNDPAADFQAMLEDAKGGTLFIDEAYGFTPAKAGSPPNPSNQVLDYLLQVTSRLKLA